MTATYRLQLHRDLPFAAAERIVPYLARLGVSHLYLSPVLTAVPGSEHGYDVLDHTSVSAELGGVEGLRSLAGAAHAAGLGLVVDIVPNHMALAAPQHTNAPLWQVLRLGRQASTAHWFDIDWEANGGRLGLPVLGDDVEAVIAAGELTLGEHEGAPVVRYHDHVLPLAEGSLDGLPDPAEALGGGTRRTALEPEQWRALLDRQHWVLASWRDAEVLSYRRFFEVDQLIALRVEEQDVFDATHALLLRLHHEGVIDAFRVDHPDGLADPQGYLDRLAAACRPGTRIWVEKILEKGADERLPHAWACSGTTGYDALAALQPALVGAHGVEAVSESWEAVAGSASIAPVVERSKRLVATELLRPEVARLHRRAAQALGRPGAAPPQHHHAVAAEPGDDTPEAAQDLRDALVELLVGIDVYRAYVDPGDPAATTQQAARHLARAVEHARAQRPDLAALLGELHGILLDPASAPGDVGAARDLAVRYQQTCGPVMAKGIEDTAFYRWHRLIALNEVGGDPDDGLEPGPGHLHAWAAHQQEHWPHGLTTLSTHDTKRSADVRARLLALAAHPHHWERLSTLTRALAAASGLGGQTGHLVWQTVFGAGPGELTAERLHDYLTKALREGKTMTTWVAPDEGWEARVQRFAEGALAGEADTSLARVLEAVDADEAVQATVASRVLAQVALQGCLPGIPDTYQGTEGYELSLVDPDNRRPVDHDDLLARLTRLDGRAAPADLTDASLLVCSRLLRLRRDRPEVLGPQVGYTPLEVPGCVAFLRGERLVALARVEPEPEAESGSGADALVALPAGTWRHVWDTAAPPVESDGTPVPAARLLGELLGEHGVGVWTA